MGKFDNWLSRVSSFWTFVAPLAPGTIGGIVLGIASRGVAWISQFGAFGWIATGVVAFVLITVAFAVAARARLWWAEASHRNRLSGDSVGFDPMERVYRDKRIYLRDLAPLGRKRVTGKKFINCEIVGPGTAIIGLDSDPGKSHSILKQCNTYDVDCIEIDPNRISNLAIGFWDCDFEGCDFYHMTLLFMQRGNEGLPWITPDFRQPPLIPGRPIP